MKSFLIKQIILSLVVFCGVFNYADALTVSPARLEISGEKGEVVTKEITILNENKIIPQNLFISFANFEAQGETGSPHFIEPTNGIGTWMSGPSSVTLAPGESKNVSIKISIPKDADSGGHFGAVFFGTAPSGQNGQVSISAKTGVLVLLSVPGDINEAGGLVSFVTKEKRFFFTSLPVIFEYRFRNDGSDRVRPEGSIVIRNSVFYPTKKLDANISMGNVLPHSTRLFETKWLEYTPLESERIFDNKSASFFHSVKYEWKNFALGIYNANLSLTYGSQNIEAQDGLWFFVFPWHLIIVFVILGVLVFIGGRLLVRRYDSYVIKKARANM